MTTLTHQFRASYAFIERNANLVKRYWTWELVWLVYSIADCMAVSFIGLGMEEIGQVKPSDTEYIVLYLLIGTLVWRFLSIIFIWITELISIERWEGTIEYTLMAPVRRIVHVAGQTIFAIAYSLVFTTIILVVTTMIFDLNMEQANLAGGLVMLLSGSFAFVGISIMASSLPLLFPERGAQMTHVFIAILLLISGVYYPVEVLPEFLERLSKFSPATYVLEGTRQALLEGTPTDQLWDQIWPVIILGIVLVPLGMWVFGVAETYAKRNGKLHRNG